MGSKGSAPAAPDPMATAQAQAQMNKDTALANFALNTPNIIGPTQMTYFTGAPNPDNPIPGQYSQITALTPSTQFQVNAAQSLGAQLGQRAMDIAAQTNIAPISTNNLPPMAMGINPNGSIMTAPGQVELPLGQYSYDMNAVPQASEMAILAPYINAKGQAYGQAPAPQQMQPMGQASAGNAGPRFAPPGFDAYAQPVPLPGQQMQQAAPPPAPGGLANMSDAAAAQLARGLDFPLGPQAMPNERAAPPAGNAQADAQQALKDRVMAADRRRRDALNSYATEYGAKIMPTLPEWYNDQSQLMPLDFAYRDVGTGMDDFVNYRANPWMIDPSELSGAQREQVRKQQLAYKPTEQEISDRRMYELMGLG